MPNAKSNKLSRKQIIMIRLAVIAVCVTTGALLIAHSADRPTMFGMGVLVAVFGTLLSWTIGSPNPNARRRTR